MTFRCGAFSLTGMVGVWVLAGRFVTNEMAIFSDKFLYFLSDCTLVSSSCRVVSKNRSVFGPHPGRCCRGQAKLVRRSCHIRVMLLWVRWFEVMVANGRLWGCA